MGSSSGQSTSSVRSAHISPSADGLEMFLGPTEAQIMSIIWDDWSNPGSSRKDWTVRLIQKRIALLSIQLKVAGLQTTMNRLSKKGFLIRRRILSGGYGDSTQYAYAPALTQTEFERLMITQTIDAFGREYSDLLDEVLANRGRI